MATHLTVTDSEGVTYTSVEQPDPLVIEGERLCEFDYALGLIGEITSGAAYEWDGPQTMRVIAFIATEHLTSHGQALHLSPSDFDKIREAVER